MKLSTEKDNILNYADTHGSYRVDTIAKNYADCCELVDDGYMSMENTSGSCLTGFRTLKLTVKGIEYIKNR